MLLALHAAVTWALVGLIWTIQVVHYPLFDAVDAERFAVFHARHARRISLLVGVLMPVEAGLAVWLAWTQPSLATWLGVGLVAAIWLATALLAVPRHAELADGYDAVAHRRLVTTNWVRTVLWSARGVLALLLLIA